MVILNVDFLKRNIAITTPILAVLFPAIVSVIMAFVRVRVVHKIEYKPNLKNFALFLSIVSLALLVEKILYSILHQPDLAGIAVFSVIFLISLAFYRFSKEKVNYKTVAKMLVVVSIVFVFVWFIFTVIVRAIYSLIVLTSWLIILVISLRVLLKKEISK